jgi:hypothetical protein
MTKLMTATGAAVLSLSLAALGYAAQGGHDPGDSSSPAKSDAASPSMGSDRGSQQDTGAGASEQPKKKRRAGESSSSMDTDRNTGSSSKKAPAPPVPSEGSNPSLDKAGKGSASGG